MITKRKGPPDVAEQVGKELVSAAAAGVRNFLSTTRGAALCGSGSKVTISEDGAALMIAAEGRHVYYLIETANLSWG